MKKRKKLIILMICLILLTSCFRTVIINVKDIEKITFAELKDKSCREIIEKYINQLNEVESNRADIIDQILKADGYRIIINQE